MRAHHSRPRNRDHLPILAGNFSRLTHKENVTLMVDVIPMPFLCAFWPIFFTIQELETMAFTGLSSPKHSIGET